MMLMLLLISMLAVVVRSAAENDPTSSGRHSEPVTEQNRVHINYVVEPTNDGKGTRTTRGPGGYTEDEETWSCLNVSELPLDFFRISRILTSFLSSGLRYQTR